MVNPFVDKATSDKLIGPDWAMNIEICDTMNRDPGQIKDVIKGLKKRLKSKNPKVQVLALTLLDTILKNCPNVVLMYIVEKNIHLVLVKIGSKKSDGSVSDKLDTVLETWHQVFGNSRPGHPQFYAAQQEILRAARPAFPKKSDRSTPIYTNPRTHPQTSYQSNNPNPDYQQEGADSSTGSDFPTLSLAEIQNVGALIDILADMLNALDPGDKEGLRQDVIVDLVGQSRNYKQRLVHLINTASDEELIRQGLTLNDDLHHILAKYETMVSGTSVQVEKPENQGPLLDVKDLIVATGDYCEPSDERSSSSTASQCPVQLKLPARPASDDPIGPMIDLLSGEDFNSPKADNSLALVPVNEPQATSSETQQNSLALPVMLSQTSSATDSLNSESNYPAGQTYYLTTQFQNQQPMFYSNGSDNPAWNYQGTQGLSNEQQQPHYGGSAQSSGGLPPPPWETQPTDNSQLVGIHQPQQLQVSQMVLTQSQQTLSSTYPHPMGNDNVLGTYIPPITNSHLANLHNRPIQSNQLVGIPQSTQGSQMMVMLPRAIHGSQVASMNPQTLPNNQLESYGYDQNQGVQFLNQGMHGLSMQDDNAMQNYSSNQMPTYLLMNKPSNSGDTKLFGDLVDMAKLKPKNPTHDTGGSL